MRLLGALLLMGALARADLAVEVKRAFRPDEPDERIGRLLAAKTEIGGADRRERNKAAAAVERALKGEVAPIVRMASMDFLLALRTDRALDRLVAGVLDRAAAVRAHVHGIVRNHADPRLFEAVLRALREDASWRFRAAMVDLLLSGARRRARRPLVAALADGPPPRRARPAEAPARRTGQAVGLDPAKGGKWFTEQAPAPRRNGESVTVADGQRKVELKKGPIRGVVPRLYTIPIREKRAVFVVDMSSSMRKGLRSTHFHELKEALFGLPADVAFSVLCFDENMYFFPSKAKSMVPRRRRTRTRSPAGSTPFRPAARRTSFSPS